MTGLAILLGFLACGLLGGIVGYRTCLGRFQRHFDIQEAEAEERAAEVPRGGIRLRRIKIHR